MTVYAMGGSRLKSQITHEQQIAQHISLACSHCRLCIFVSLYGTTWLGSCLNYHDLQTLFLIPMSLLYQVMSSHQCNVHESHYIQWHTTF